MATGLADSITCQAKAGLIYSQVSGDRANAIAGFPYANS